MYFHIINSGVCMYIISIDLIHSVNYHIECLLQNQTGWIHHQSPLILMI